VNTTSTRKRRTPPGGKPVAATVRAWLLRLLRVGEQASGGTLEPREGREQPSRKKAAVERPAPPSVPPGSASMV
jgi:hypothetical protein